MNDKPLHWKTRSGVLIVVAVNRYTYLSVIAGIALCPAHPVPLQSTRVTHESPALARCELQKSGALAQMAAMAPSTFEFALLGYRFIQPIGVGSWVVWKCSWVGSCCVSGSARRASINILWVERESAMVPQTTHAATNIVTTKESTNPLAATSTAATNTRTTGTKRRRLGWLLSNRIATNVPRNLKLGVHGSAQSANDTL